jgi:hypothetical protein
MLKSAEKHSYIVIGNSEEKRAFGRHGYTGEGNIEMDN